VTISASGAVVALTPGTAWAATNAMAWRGGGGTTPPKAPVGFKSHRAFKKAMGSAGPGKEWHHIVEQTDGNVDRFHPGAAPLNGERDRDRQVVARQDRPVLLLEGVQIYGTRALTVRAWLSTQPFEAQRTFGLEILRIILSGGDP